MMQAGIFGFLTALIGLWMGGFLALGTQNYGKRFQGGLMGFTGGLLIAFVCFELLPNAFEGNRYYSVIIGMLAGVFVTTYLEGWADRFSSRRKESEFCKTGLLLSLGILIHNIPEGMAIGSLIIISPLEGFRLCIILAMHCIPEGLMIFLALKEKKNTLIFAASSFFLLSFSMGVGGFIGAAVSAVSSELMSICFSFAGGVMLYVTCGEIIPESKEIWKGRLTTIGSLMGFLLGVAVIAGL